MTPPFMTHFTFSISAGSFSGFPGTAMMSANVPALITPTLTLWCSLPHGSVYVLCQLRMPLHVGVSGTGSFQVRMNIT
jgi:hypothetical protein